MRPIVKLIRIARQHSAAGLRRMPNRADRQRVILKVIAVSKEKVSNGKYD